jgi:hypothetical protein
MDLTAIRLHAPASTSVPAPALTLRPLRSADAPEPAVLHRDEALGRWVGSVVGDEAGAAAGVAEGDRFAFAVGEARQGRYTVRRPGRVPGSREARAWPGAPWTH